MTLKVLCILSVYISIGYVCDSYSDFSCCKQQSIVTVVYVSSTCELNMSILASVLIALSFL